ncbi:hypothetical protein Bca52824_071789 [Brassica carinata]|uniref:Nodule Cysteine-Rich (NCR) secreted peptide n=1 Tax=Brassica carinata TaxID=52824 RepID=A0A8X7Q6Z7_BRACI|nr:hypothetical protein Bca52824_071789 [Brassica carinata]
MAFSKIALLLILNVIFFTLVSSNPVPYRKPTCKMLLNSRCVPMCWIWLRFLYHKDPNVADLSKV